MPDLQQYILRKEIGSPVLKQMMKKKSICSNSRLKRLVTVLAIYFSFLCLPQQVLASSPFESGSPVPAAAAKLVQFCSDSKAKLDMQAIAALADYVLETKTEKEIELPKLHDATGAYYEFETKTNFLNFLQYSYSHQIPSGLTNPASLRYSLWNCNSGDSSKLPDNWKTALAAGKPLILRGLQRDGITPDLNTGIYYEYDLKRTLILLNHKGRQAIISVSKQVDKSDVGRKGIIIGNDDDWNYYYSGEPGLPTTGLGWVKSYIYDYFSVGIHVEAGNSPCTVKSGMFQWLRAGWSGINFVQSGHIISGMKRNAKNFKAVLESPKLPAPNQITAAYQRLYALPKNDLLEKYIALQQARQALAAQNGKIKTSDVRKQDSYADIPKEQIVEELMLEYFKITLGKASLLESKILLAIN